MKIKQEEGKEKLFETFASIRKKYENQPKRTFVWNGIKEGSFGLIFGPPKSGKTIFCENLALNLVLGSNEFMGYELKGESEKILFIGLEEYWVERVERNTQQYETFNKEEQELIDQKYLFQKINFTRKIISEKNWEDLENTIVASEAKIVFIDSITRMNHGKLEDSKTAEEIMQRLRELCHKLKITLICIHHTPKLYDKPIVMDSMKGSTTFSAESDFGIGVNRTTKNHRYFKNIFFRYSSDSDQTAQEFEIDDNMKLNFLRKSEEDDVLSRTDRRKTIGKKQKVIEYFSSNPDTTFSKGQLVNYFQNELKVKRRMVEHYLKEAITKDLIISPERGYYKYNLKK